MSASEKTAGQVAFEYYWPHHTPDAWDKNVLDKHVWENLAVAIVAHVRPQIEAEARAAAIGEAASLIEDTEAGRNGKVWRSVSDCIASVRGLATAPAGHVCVPVEPTSDMLTAGEGIAWPERDIYEILDTLDCREAAKEVYKAMLAAVPK